MVIPNLTGLFGHISFSSYLYWIGYSYFILLSFTIWQGNRYLLFKQREHFDWFDNPVRKLTMLIAANVFYTAPLTSIWLIGWYWFAGFNQTDWNVIYLVTLMNVIAVIFITHVYETVFLIKERERDIVEVEQLKRSKVEAELQALKNQVDPHFMFNSLNTLSYLIEHSKEKALTFNENLSFVYRYILMNKSKNLVQLTEEIRFLQNYYSLIKIRYETGIELKLKLENNYEEYLLPPISLQVLLENTIKHTEFDDSNKLIIDVIQQNSSVVIRNNKRVKELPKPGSKVGLINLSERYRLSTGKNIEIDDGENYFSVSLPLLKMSS